MFKRIMISLPSAFLAEMDELASEEKRTRSELIRESFRMYLRNKKSTHLVQPHNGGIY